MSDRQIQRHSGAAIFIHWFNALAWFFLLATGLALIDNPSLQILGPSYGKAVRDFFGGGGALLRWHWGVGAVWVGVWLLWLAVYGLRLAMPFLLDIHRYSLPRDLQWMVKKNLQMTLGSKAMARLVKPLGWDGIIPDQGYYNAGQKAAALGLVGGGAMLAATGLIMVVGKYFLSAAWLLLVQWSISLHFIFAGLTFGLLLIHIYMAAISPEERPALFSMFKGKVPASYAEHHHKLWYQEIKQSPANREVAA